MLVHHIEILKLSLRLALGLDEDDNQLTLSNVIPILLFMKYRLAFNRLKIFQRLFTQWVIMKVPFKLNKMIKA